MPTWQWPAGSSRRRPGRRRGARRGLALHETGSQLARAIGSDRKGRLSLGLYVVALVCAFFVPGVSIALFVTVAVIWIVPDRRVVRVLGS